MGLGDEIMALGRAERIYEATGKQVSILTMTEAPRDHPAWHGNSAWVHKGGKRLIDGGGARDYLHGFKGRKAIFKMDHCARAGRIHISDETRNACPLVPPYAIVAPHLKTGASPNKNYGAGRWEKVIKDFPIPVIQLVQDDKEKVIAGATAHKTASIYAAIAAIEKAAVVMCNEGGTHHMAAGLHVPAVVFFGSFVPPQVTGYEYHYNIAVETDHGYCGNWDLCSQCTESKKMVDPETIREKAILMMESYNVY